MPYVKEDRRNIWLRKLPTTAGDLNYDITCLLLEYVEEHGLGYETLNTVGGALNYANLEFYRRVVAPYEDRKREENGDVYNQFVWHPTI